MQNSSRRKLNPPVRASLTMLAVLHTALTACTDPAEQADTTASQSDQGLCEQFSRDKVDAAFAGKLPLGEMKGWPGRCRYRIEFGSPEVRDANELNITVTTAGNYEAMMNWQNQSSATFEFIDGIGEQAFIVNNTDLLVKLDGSNYMRFSLRVLTFGDPLPMQPEEVRQSLLTVGRMAE